jgi:hypothetical protein
MNSTSKTWRAASLLAAFGCGLLVARWTQPSEPIRIDARPGVEFEVKSAQGFEPKTLVCRIDDSEVTP